MQGLKSGKLFEIKKKILFWYIKLFVFNLGRFCFFMRNIPMALWIVATEIWYNISEKHLDNCMCSLFYVLFTHVLFFLIKKCMGLWHRATGV